MAQHKTKEYCESKRIIIQMQVLDSEAMNFIQHSLPLQYAKELNVCLILEAEGHMLCDNG
jgi:hypothetical protein